MTRARVVQALQGRAEAIKGADVAQAAGLPYKATVDALGWLLDTGVVVRIGRKYSARWALAGSPAAPSTAAADALEAAWRRAGPAPHGGEAEGTPPSAISL